MERLSYEGMPSGTDAAEVVHENEMKYGESERAAKAYEGVNLRKYANMYSLYRKLDYGADICMGGDDWTTTQNVNDKKTCIRILRDAYKEVGHLEEQAKKDLEDWVKEHSWSDKDEFVEGIAAICFLCQDYHKEAEYLDKYLDEPGQAGEHGGSGRNQLPTAIDTPRAQECFKRAEERGYMEKTDTGHNWTFGGNRGKARLAYFLERVYCPNREDKMTSGAWRSLEKHFNVTRLDSAANQNAGIAGTQATVKEWREKIDKITPKPKAK